MLIRQSCLKAYVFALYGLQTVTAVTTKSVSQSHLPAFTPSHNNIKEPGSCPSVALSETVGLHSKLSLSSISTEPLFPRQSIHIGHHETKSHRSQPEHSRPSHGGHNDMRAGLNMSASLHPSAERSHHGSATLTHVSSLTTTMSTLLPEDISTMSNSSIRNQTRAADWQECQASRVSWSDAFDRGLYTGSVISSTRTVPSSIWSVKESTIITHGTASQPYATIDGYPHVKGGFTITSTSLSVWYSTFSSPPSTRIDYDFSYDISSPTCVIPDSRCSAMWTTYFSSLGLPTSNIAHAVEPSITPMPSNRPRCSLGNPEFPCTSKQGNLIEFSLCEVNPIHLKLLYWPPNNKLKNATLVSSDSKVVTAHYGTYLFTSPTVYLTYPPVTFTAYGSYTTSCEPSHIPLGASTGPTFPAFFTTTLVELPASILSMQAEDVSSVQWQFLPGANTSQYVRSMAQYGPGTFESQKMTTAVLPVDFSALQQPSPEAYFLDFTPTGLPNETFNGIIYDDIYAPVLNVFPDLLSQLPEAFRTCSPGLEWFFDPPSALQPAVRAATPTMPKPLMVSATSGTSICHSTPTQVASPGRNSPTPLPASTAVSSWTTSTLVQPSVSTPNSPIDTQSGIEHIVEPSLPSALSVAVVTAEESTWTVFRSEEAGIVSIASTILTVGGPAVDFGGIWISAASNGMVVGSETVSYSRYSNEHTVTTAGSLTATVESSGFTVDTSDVFDANATLPSSGGPGVVINSETMSVAAGGLAIDQGTTKTTTSSGASTPGSFFASSSRFDHQPDVIVDSHSSQPNVKIGVSPTNRPSMVIQSDAVRNGVTMWTVTLMFWSWWFV